MSEQAEQNTEDQIEITPRRWRNLIILMLLLIPMLGISGFLAFGKLEEPSDPGRAVTKYGRLAALLGDDPIIVKGFGWFGLVFFGAGGVAGIVSMRSSKPSVVISNDGIATLYRNRTALIPWADIEHIGVAKMHSNKFAAIRLLSSDRYLNSLSGAKREKPRTKSRKVNRVLTGGYDVMFSWNQIDRSPKKFVELLNSEWQRRAGGPEKQDATDQA